MTIKAQTEPCMDYRAAWVEAQEALVEANRELARLRAGVNDVYDRAMKEPPSYLRGFVLGRVGKLRRP